MLFLQLANGKDSRVFFAGCLTSQEKNTKIAWKTLLSAIFSQYIEGIPAFGQICLINRTACVFRLTLAKKRGLESFYQR